MATHDFSAKPSYETSQNRAITKNPLFLGGVLFLRGSYISRIPIALTVQGYPRYVSNTS